MPKRIAPPLIQRHCAKYAPGLNRGLFLDRRQFLNGLPEPVHGAVAVHELLDRFEMVEVRMSWYALRNWSGQSKRRKGNEVPDAAGVLSRSDVS